jgi:hypothetical protein
VIDVPVRACGMWHLLVQFADSHRQSWVQASREKWQVAFPKADTHWDWVQADGAYVGCPQVRGPVHRTVQFCLILSLLVFARDEKEKKKVEGEMARGFS